MSPELAVPAMGGGSARPWPGQTVPPQPVDAAPAGVLAVAGGHGGAGTTTLAVLLQPSWDMGVLPGPSRRYPRIRCAGLPLVLVTRNTVMAAARATAAINTITFSAGRVLVLAIVSDGLPDPAEATYRFRLLDARVGAIVRVPFVPALRVTDDPLRVELPRKARRALAEIRARAGACAPVLAPGRGSAPGAGLAPGTGPAPGAGLPSRRL